MNLLIAAVLFGLGFAALNGVFSALLRLASQRAPLPALRAADVETRAAWSGTLLALPPLMSLAVLLPVVFGAVAGWLPVADWCARLHTHCDLALGSESATEVIVYAVAGALLMGTLGVAAARLAAPLVWIRRRRPPALPCSATRTLEAALSRFTAAGECPPHVHVVPAFGGGAAIFGLRRPSVVLSVELLTALTVDEVYAVLRHERAHFDRHDGLLGLLLGLSRGVTLGPSAGPALLARWHHDREILCDRAAVRAGADPLALAQSLVTAARLPRRPVPWFCPTLVDGPVHTLSERVHDLLAAPVLPAPTAGRPALVFALTLLALTAAAAVASSEALWSLHCLVEEGVHLLS